MRRMLYLGLAVAVAFPGGLLGPPAASAADGEGASLYERLGGVYPIAQVVDDFIDRVVNNETINANPNIYAARKEERFPGLKFQLTAMVCQATGGPCRYTGKSMKEAHLGMEITAAEWQALAEDFKASLDHFGVGAAEQAELFAIVETTKGDIVVSP